MSDKITPIGETLVIENVNLKELNEQREVLGGVVCNLQIMARCTDQEVAALDGILNMLDAWSDKRDGLELTRENIQIIAEHMADELAADKDQLDAFVEDVLTAQYNADGGYDFFVEDWTRYVDDD